MAFEEEIRRIEEMEDRRYRAMREGDVAALDALCSSRLLYTHSRGERDDKQSYLDKVRSGIFVYHEIAHPADRILITDGAALVTGRMTARVSVAGEMRHIDNSYLAVWIKEAGAWKFVAYQPTPILKA